MKTIMTLGLALVAAAASPAIAHAAGGICPKTIDVGKQWTADASTQGGYGNWTWSAGVGVNVKLFGDCNAIGVEGSAELRSRVLGAFVLKPAEARLVAQTDQDDRQSLELKFLALGLEIESYTIADSQETLKASVLSSHVLPDGFSDSVGPLSFGVEGYSLQFGVSYEAVGQYLAIFNYDIGPKKLDARVYAYVDAGASLSATGTLDIPLADLTLQGTASIDLIRGYADARGSFTETYKELPKAPTLSASALSLPTINNAWIVKGSAGYYIYEGLQGSLVASITGLVTVDIPFTDETAELPIEMSEELLALDGLPATFARSNGWSYEKVYFKPF